MSGRRGSAVRRRRDGFKVPAGAPSYCQALDGMDEAEARGLIEPCTRYSIGADRTYVAAVKCDGEGQPFRVLDCADTVRGVLASWDAAARLMVALAVEHEAGRVEGARS